MSRSPEPYEAQGRAEQKQRTRTALVAAARDLVSSGATPTVEQAATDAGISRTTAYRYFPNQRALLAAAHPEVAAASLLGSHPPAEPDLRLDRVIGAFVQLIVETEPQQRTMLRLSLQPAADGRPELPLRQGRAIGWIREALEPLEARLTEDELHLLILAVRSAVGIEALVWLTDVAGLSREAAAQLMRWSAQALLSAVLSSTVPPPSLAEL